MEADWAAEIGPRLDRIDCNWQGFIDLRADAAAVRSIPEAAPGSALQEALAALNVASSSVFTCKCDRWQVAADELDPYELGSSRETACVGVASYVDVVARDAELFASFAGHEAWARETVLRLRKLGISNGRADLVIRAALNDQGSGFGITLYATGCGPDVRAAEDAWTPILRALVAVTMGEAHTARASSSIG